jgi:hypothetical protein
VIATGDVFAAAMEIENDFCALAALLSVTFATNEDCPDSLGVPDSTPVEGFRLTPAGKAPLASDQP